MGKDEKLIFWELNEINFEYVSYYISEGKLPNWKNFIKSHGLFTTIADEKYNQLEPWIQWPTIRTGLTFDEHNVFRLGDIVDSELKQHWEVLESKGYNVAAISPINASNNTKNSSFWIPDPWVETEISGNSFIRRFSKALKQTVNDNSQKKISLSSVFAILECLITRSKWSSWQVYLSSIYGAIKKQHWSKAIFLDRMLADLFLNLWKKNQPDFSVLFLNSGAHIQHHYMCNSPFYTGTSTNPKWYISNKKDPLLEILEMYDSFLNEIQNLSNTRLMIAVGLRQVPFEKPNFYWRLKNHDEFLIKLGIEFKKTLPRMTRDFLIEFETSKEALQAEKILKKIKSKFGDLIFGEVDNRGKNLFVSLTFSEEITDSFSIFIDELEFKDFKEDVSFVAIKNGHHHNLGYFLDSSRSPSIQNAEIPVQKIYSYVMNHFGI